MRHRLKTGWWLNLIPREPKGEPGIVLNGYIEWIDAPRFGLNYSDGRGRMQGMGASFRFDENEELAIREIDSSVWEIGLMSPRANSND